ncbi:LysR substrate-binding domain-containing protein [Oxalobacteraceae bacterium A2-2]
MREIPPLAALRCFESAARLGSVTAAARELHVTHSAVSQQIRVLEEWMGVALFQREARGLRLTDAGRLYALDVRAALRGIADATRHAQARPQQSELVVTTLPSFATHWLAPRLGGFRAAYPQYRLRLHTSLEVQGLGPGGAAKGMADIGIRMGKGDWPGLSSRVLFEDELLVVASPQFVLQFAPQGLGAQEIAQAPRIECPDAPWGSWCQAAGVEKAPGRAVLHANDSNVILAALAQGTELALERRSLVAEALRRGELVQLSPVTVPYPYQYWLVWQPRDGLSPGQRHFMEWLEAEVANQYRT